jgi:hypothetical protein
MSTIPEYNIREALERARGGLVTDATLHIGRAGHARTNPTRFDENVQALVEYLEYERDRRREGPPDWSDDRWKAYNRQADRLNRIPAHLRMCLADAVESKQLTIPVIRQYMVTGQLQPETPPRRTAARPRKKAASTIKEESAAA